MGGRRWCFTIAQCAGEEVGDGKVAVVFHSSAVRCARKSYIQCAMHWREWRHASALHESVTLCSQCTRASLLGDAYQRLVSLDRPRGVAQARDCHAEVFHVLGVHVDGLGIP